MSGHLQPKLVVLSAGSDSTASNPADRAAAGRFSSGSSVNKIEQLTSNRWP
jgi:hypothetical protein